MSITAVRDASVPNPKKKSDRKSVRIEVMVTEDWAETFKAEADSWDIDLSQYIRIACEEKRRRERGTEPDAD